METGHERINRKICLVEILDYGVLFWDFPSFRNVSSSSRCNVSTTDKEPVGNAEDLDDDLQKYCVLSQNSNALCATEDDWVTKVNPYQHLKNFWKPNSMTCIAKI